MCVFAKLAFRVQTPPVGRVLRSRSCNLVYECMRPSSRVSQKGVTVGRTVPVLWTISGVRGGGGRNVDISNACAGLSSGPRVMIFEGNVHLTVLKLCFKSH